MDEVCCIVILWIIAPSSYDNVPEVKYERNGNFNSLQYNQFVWINLEEIETKENFDEVIKDSVNLGCQAWIVANEGVKDFLNAYAEVVETCEQRPQKVHMIFHLNDSSEDISREILSHRTLEDVPNILLIIPSTTSRHNADDGESFDLVTSPFAGRFNNTHPILLDVFGNSTLTSDANLFPDKLQNLQQRHLRLSLFNYKPYTTVQHVDAGKGNANAMMTEEELTILIDGTECLMFLEFCSRHNCTLFISEDEEGQWGVIYENRTGNGLTGAVVERRAEASVGALYMWYYESQFLTLSKIISRTGITCIVPRPALLPGWLTPILPFSPTLWIACLASLLLGIIGLQTIAKYHKSSAVHQSDERRSFVNSVLTVMAIYVLQPIEFIDRRFIERTVIGCILVTGWLIGNIYASGLASVMTIPRFVAPIDTPEDLAASGMEWSATHDAWIFSIQSATEPLLVTLVKNFRIRSHEQLRSHSLRSDIGFSIERLQYGHFAIGDYIQEDILDDYQIMVQDIYWEYCVVMSYKTWSLLPMFDDLVLHVAESGIQKYWELLVAQRHQNIQVQLGVAQSRHHDSLGPEPLKPTHLFGLFAVWGLGMMLATAVFLAETCWRFKTQ
ncbi:uncharacterized protein LOC132255993 [Phlebotomus argentipes]|uniref:uncharacterized protein LOC132255993 n=1 Tax=Phlebotomus argentipes TaxID=94469 RepID=UPI0028930188|nr:uncharacterized protein LOC132255993 [Phlebotomus argentipes]